MKKQFRLFPFLTLIGAISFYSCTQDEPLVNESNVNSIETITVAKSSDNWQDYVTESSEATPDNSIVFSTQEEYDEFVSNLHQSINETEDSEIWLDYVGEAGYSARGCADGVYYGSGMTSGFATLGFDVTVSGGCITGVNGAFTGLTLGVSYEQGGSSGGCKSTTVCGNVNYNMFLEGIGTVYSRRVCYKISLGC